jgi:hypothetical protein
MKRELIEVAVSLAEAETNSRPSLSALAGHARIPVVGTERPRTARGARWTPAEDAFLRAQLGLLPEAEIGRAIGRTVVAVQNRWKRDLHLVAPRRNPNWLTLEAFARGLGADQKTMAKLADRGKISVRRLPQVIATNGRGLIRVIDRKEALAWIANPMHWIYFKPERVGMFRKQGQRRMARPDVVFWRGARAAVDALRKTWGDSWLTPTQTANLVGLPFGNHSRRSCGGLNKAIRAGILPAVRWGNWWILRSKALKFARERMTGGWGPQKIKWIHFKCPVAPKKRGRREARRDRPARQAEPA